MYLKIQRWNKLRNYAANEDWSISLLEIINQMNNAKLLLQYYQSLLDCMDIDREQLYVHVSNHIYLNQARDPRTRAPHHNRKFFVKHGLHRTRTNKTRIYRTNSHWAVRGPSGAWIPEPDIAVWKEFDHFRIRPFILFEMGKCRFVFVRAHWIYIKARFIVLSTCLAYFRNMYHWYL